MAVGSEKAWHDYLAPISFDPWHAGKFGADLGGWIEVKTTLDPLPPDNCHMSITEKLPIKPNWAYALAVPCREGYWLVGWEWGDIVLTYPPRLIHKGRPKCRWIPSAALRPPASLLAIWKNDAQLAIDIGRQSDYVTARV